MEMHQLRYFVAVAETGSFSRAAERCLVSQPSLSQQIAKLENYLRQRLFDRLGRRVVLTEAGRLLLDRARSILEAVSDAEHQLRDGGEAGPGRLSVGAIPTMAPYLFPRLLPAFLRRHPGLELTVTEDYTERLVAAIVGGEMDLALMALPLHDDRLLIEPLFAEPLLLVLPQGHALARRRMVKLGDLKDEPFILLNEVHCLGEQVLTFCKHQSFQPRVVCRGAQIATIQELVSLGQGLSLLPDMARHADGSKRRVYRPLSGAPARTVVVVRHRQRYHSPVAARFEAQLRQLGVH
jgi:LysR family hydrogen peroxide-inducible transcriptional activator